MDHFMNDFKDWKLHTTFQLSQDEAPVSMEFDGDGCWGLLIVVLQE